MENKNKVSVIIPCYNDGEYLQEAVESVEKCDKQLYEIIIVDDGSIDNLTKKVLSSMKKKGYRVLKIDHKGPSAARNFGVKHAKFSYLLFLDSDNKINKDYISNGISILNKNPEIGVVYGDKREFGLKNRLIYQKEFDVSEVFFFECIVDTCAVVRKRVWEDCKGFDENMFMWEDWEFSINAYEKGWKFYHIPEVMFYYRLKDHSVNTQAFIRENRLKALDYVYRKHFSLFLKCFERRLQAFNPKLNNLFENELIFERVKNEELVAHLKNIELSLTWKLLRAYQNIIEILFPKESFFREIYDGLIRFNQNIFSNKNNFSSITNYYTNRFWEEFLIKHKPVDILFVNHEETRTGAPKLILDIARNLSDDYNVSMVSKKMGSMHEEFVRVFKDIIYPEKLYIGGSKEEVARSVILKVNPKIVYVNTIAGYEYAKEAMKFNIPVVFHIHELDSVFNSFLTKKEINQFSKQASIFIAASNKVRDYLVNDIGCLDSRVIVINDSIYAPEVISKSREKEKKEIYSEIGYKKNQLLVVSVGSVIKRKGPDLLFDSCKILEKKYPGKFKFIWIGVLPSDDDSLDFYQKKDNFLFLGEKENPYPYINAGDVFVLPSREDPFPLVVLEALALKKPVISFKSSGGVSEILDKRGILVENMNSQDLAKALEDLAVNRSLMNNLIKSLDSNFDGGWKISKEKVERIVSDTFKKFVYRVDNNLEFIDKVSIVLPSYNQEWCISDSIDSIINQTYGNWELIVIDDSSSDKTRDIVKQYIKKYPGKIRLIKKDKDKRGLASSYGVGIKECTGDYVAFLEGDDIWKKDNLINKLIIFQNHLDVGCVFSNVQSFGESELLIQRNEEVSYFFRDLDIPSGPFDMKKLISDRLPVKSFSSVVVRRELLNGLDFSNDYDIWFDWWFHTQLSLLCKYLYLNEKTVKWRVHSSSYFEDYKRNNDIRNRYSLIQKRIQDYLSNK